MDNFEDDFIITENELIFNPFNPLNKEITQKDIENLLTMYGLPPKVYNMKLYKRAFVHRSYTKRPDIENNHQKIKIVEKPVNCLPLSTKSNERLEFIGDGILEFVTKFYLYRRFPKENEGFMTEKKIALVKNESIGKIAMDIGLNKWLILSKHAEDKKIRNNLKKLGCLFESFIAAVFLDFNKLKINDEDKWFDNLFVCGPGFQMVQILIENIFEKHVNWINLILNDDNYKNILQVKIQKEFKVTPHYIEMEYNNEDGFKMGVYLCININIHNLNYKNAITQIVNIHDYLKKNNNKIFLFLGEGNHKIKRKAEQIACFQALELLDKINNK